MHFDEEGYPDVVATALPPLSDKNRDGLTGGLYVDSLTAADLDAAGVDAPDVTDVVGAMGSVTYRNALDDVLPVLTSEHKDELFDTYVAYDVRETTDRDCFLSRACPRLEQTIHEITVVPLLGEATRDYTLAFQWTHADDGTEGILARSLSPDPVEFNTSIAAVFQQYQLYAIYPDGDATRRDEAFWADAEFIGINVPKSFMVDTAVDEMADQAGRVDDAVDAGLSR